MFDCKFVLSVKHLRMMDVIQRSFFRLCYNFSGRKAPDMCGGNFASSCKLLSNSPITVLVFEKRVTIAAHFPDALLYDSLLSRFVAHIINHYIIIYVYPFPVEKKLKP